MGFMCYTLVTKDGIELRTIGEAKRYGITIPAEALTEYSGGAACLCNVEIEPLLATHSSAWRASFALPGDGFAEVGDDGRTWWDGYDVATPDPGRARTTRLSRSDGRRAITLAQWEVSRG